jgi:hypothetical protein
VTTPAAARRFVRAALESVETDPVVIETAQLFTDELVTNAIIHAHSKSYLLIRAAQERVRVEVTDPDDRLPAMGAPDPTPAAVEASSSSTASPPPGASNGPPAAAEPSWSNCQRSATRRPGLTPPTNRQAIWASVGRGVRRRMHPRRSLTLDHSGGRRVRPIRDDFVGLSSCAQKHFR